MPRASLKLISSDSLDSSFWLKDDEPVSASFSAKQVRLVKGSPVRSPRWYRPHRVCCQMMMHCFHCDAKASLKLISSDSLDFLSVYDQNSRSSTLRFEKDSAKYLLLRVGSGGTGLSPG
jgi:hypothetical protein